MDSYILTNKSSWLIIKAIVILFALFVIRINAFSQAIDMAEIRPDGIQIPNVDHTLVANPIEGLLVYDINTSSFWYYEGTQWQEIAGSGVSLSLNEIKLENNVGDTTVCIRGEGPDSDGQIILYQQNHEIGTVIDGGEGSQGGQMLLYNSNGVNTFQLDAEGSAGNGFGAFFGMYQSNGDPTIIMDSNNDGARGGAIRLRDLQNDTKIFLVADEGGTDNGGALKMYNGDGDLAIELDAEFGAGGKGRVITEELQITGGSDFSESFNVSDKIGVEKGMVLCLDQINEGELKVSNVRYDKKVVGIVSGANGVNTGLIMSDNGTIADGEFPIALAGRVYVKVNQEGGEIQVGDFLTTSSERGKAMKAKNKRKAKGAIIGKAMTKADESGFVLVLVNLQ
jgi:hypothetical protein